MKAEAAPAARGKIRLSFAVTDSGIGLKPAEIKRLFRPFAQANDAISRRYGGSGLGLAMVKRLAKAMGGDLTVRSKPGGGSTFTFSVMVGSAEGLPAQSASRDRGRPVAARSRSLNILCVEDNPYGRVVMSTILTELGHRVAFAGTGAAALSAVLRGGYDVVLMDVTLPDLSGIEVTRRLRALHSAAGRVPVIGLSGHSGAEEEKAARAAGMNFYLAKPVGPAALAEALARVIR
jgi:CheY-like chemotaxis protein